MNSTIAVDAFSVAYDAITDFTKNFIKTKNRLAKFANIVKQYNTTEKYSIDIYISEFEVTYNELVAIVELYNQYCTATYFDESRLYVKKFSLNEAVAFFMQNYLRVCELHNLADQLEKCQ
jgi:hypothetical protein